ncbi:MAG TPA: hypothetical protein VJS42_15190 [Steroidobacteraceae bacterium]|nr:hypothetical protein [Steroidobacteraceae bacterium]
MKTKAGWGMHLRELVGSQLDTMIYALQWARDPRSIQTGAHHRRIGATSAESTSICRLWASASARRWD